MSDIQQILKEIEPALRSFYDGLSASAKARIPDLKDIASEIGKAAWTKNFHLLDELREQLRVIGAIEKRIAARIANEKFAAAVESIIILLMRIAL